MSAAGAEPAGELTGELRRLLDAVLARAAATPGGPSGAGGPAAGEHAPDCGWCPVCAVVSALRGDRPELARRLGEHGAGLAATLRALVEEHEHGRAAPEQHGRAAPEQHGRAAPEQHEPGSAADTGDGTPPPPRPRVQRITVRTATGGTR